MCVYDDVRGWNTNHLGASEFYLEYGDFDINITAQPIILLFHQRCKSAGYSFVDKID
jgi:hypothetical protein